MLSERKPLDQVFLGKVPEQAGIYIIYDLAGPIYVGRSGSNIRRRLQAHSRGAGNKNIAMARDIGALDSLTFRFCVLSGNQARQVEGLLIEALGGDKYANLRRERIPDDPTGWEARLSERIQSNAGHSPR
jgi:hypothetical protein